MENNENTTFKKLFDSRIKLLKQQLWFEEVLFSALYKGEQFLKDHNRPMTYEEKKAWVDSKKGLLE